MLDRLGPFSDVEDMEDAEERLLLDQLDSLSSSISVCASLPCSTISEKKTELQK